MKRKSLVIGFVLVLATGIVSNVNAVDTELITDDPSIPLEVQPIQVKSPLANIQYQVDTQYDLLYQLYLEEAEARSILEAQVEAIANTCLKPREPKKYYLTETYHQGDTVLTACAEGYHLASITQMRHVDELVPLVSEDFNGKGWIDIPVRNAKVKRCRDWSTANDEDYGWQFGMYDSAYDDIPSNDLNMISMSKYLMHCNEELQVWCIED